MRLLRLIRVALASIARNAMRSGLTMLGIVIGVGAVLVMIAIGQGAKSTIQDRIDALGTNLIVVTPGAAQQGGVSLGAGTMGQLTIDDAELLKREGIVISAVSPVVNTFGQLVGSIGHDLRNPLGVIETSVFILRTRVGEDERAKKHLDRIGDQLGVANGIITNLLDMIRNKPLARERVKLAGLLEGAADSVARPEIGRAHV